MLPGISGFVGMPLDARGPWEPASNSTHRASPLPTCAGGISYARLTVAGFTDAGEVTLLTADRQSFTLPFSLLPAGLEVGSVVTISFRRNPEEEAARRDAILQLQEDIIKGLQNPGRPRPKRLTDPVLLLPEPPQQQQQHSPCRG